MSRTFFTITRAYAFREVAPGLWFPESDTSVTTLIALESCTETDVAGITYHASDVKVNIKMPASRWTIEPPPSTTVIDLRTRGTFGVR